MYCMLISITYTVAGVGILCFVYVSLSHARWQGLVCYVFYPAMTAFTDQYSLRNIFFDIGQL